MKNIELLEEDLPLSLRLFTNTLRSIHKLDRGVSGKNLDPNYVELVSEFSKNWLLLKKKINVPVTNKYHIIMSNLCSYFDSEKKALGLTSDQIIEHSHQLLDKRFTTSNYKI